MSIWPLFSVWSGFDLSAWIFLGAVLDLMIGDPIWRYHPVRLTGSAIAGLENVVRRPSWGRAGLRLAGMGLTLAVVVGVLALVTAVLWAASNVSIWLFRLLVVGLAFWGLAIRGLAESALLVYRPLMQNRWDDARRQLAMIVGRDTTHLSQSEMVRATVESVAENTCDAVVAPLFYLFVGGPAWLWVYKAINTLDSMIGHTNGKYRDFGWFSARLDDVANWVPARITGVAITLAAATDGRLRQAYAVMRQDGRKHPSPNSGVSEAAMAGALGVSLGGPNVYEGVVSLRPRIGQPEYPLSPAAIVRAVSVSLRATLVVVIAFGLLAVIVSGRWLQ